MPVLRHLQVSGTTTVTVVPQETVSQILNLINAVWDTGMYVAFQDLPSLLIVRLTFSDFTLLSIFSRRQLHKTPSFALIVPWKRSPKLKLFQFFSCILPSQP